MSETGWDIFLFSVFTIGGIAAGAGFTKAGLKVHPNATPRFILSMLAVFALVVFIPIENDTPRLVLAGVWLAMLLGGALGIMETKRRCPMTSLQVAPSGSPQVRTRCFPARPPHLPARPNRATSLCGLPAEAASAQAGAGSSRRARPSMRFLSVGPPCLRADTHRQAVSPSLPPAASLPSRRWPRVVGLSCCHVRSSYKGLAPHLQRAHAGRTQTPATLRRFRCAPPARLRRDVPPARSALQEQGRFTGRTSTKRPTLRGRRRLGLWRHSCPASVPMKSCR
jgi:hypothetical protein